MLDHVFTDAITALREAFENALLERQAFEEHFQVDVLLGDVTWETSYGLPGEGSPPRVRADLTIDWPTWSQTAYRNWYIDEPLERSTPTVEQIYGADLDDGEFAIELSYEGTIPLEEATLADGSTLDEQ